MIMLVRHNTPFMADATDVLDKDGSQARVVVLKATYRIDSAGGEPSIAEMQEPVCHADLYLGEPGTSSTIYESDFGFLKPSTDIIVIGNIHAPAAATSLSATLSVGTLAKTVLVFGDRHWDKGFAGFWISDPVPFSVMPLCWERAFGGWDRTDSTSPAWEPRNPLGTGYSRRGSAKTLEGLPLPNFEDPGNVIRSWSDRPVPQGFGFTPRNSEPRIRYAGTFDAAWQKDRMPILPDDFDYRYFNGAPAYLQYPGYLVGGETVSSENLFSGYIAPFRIPALLPAVRCVAGGQRLEQGAMLDTVVLDTDKNHLVLVWRAKFTVPLNETSDEVRIKAWMNKEY